MDEKNKDIVEDTNNENINEINTTDGITDINDIDPPAKAVNKKKELIGWILTIVAAFAVFGILMIFVQPGVVDGSSMEPNYYEGDRFFVIRDWIDDDYNYGDVVCVDIDGKIIIKRIIGLPGDVIELKDGYVYRNDVKIDESAYLDSSVKTESQGLATIFIIGEGEYFVLGDNRAVSFDGRLLGPVDTVVGKTWFFFKKAWFK